MRMKLAALPLVAWISSATLFGAPPGGAISGIVVDDKGAPIANAGHIRKRANDGYYGGRTACPHRANCQRQRRYSGAAAGQPEISRDHHSLDHTLTHRSNRYETRFRSVLSCRSDASDSSRTSPESGPWSRVFGPSHPTRGARTSGHDIRSAARCPGCRRRAGPPAQLALWCLGVGSCHRADLQHDRVPNTAADSARCRSALQRYLLTGFQLIVPTHNPNYRGDPHRTRMRDPSRANMWVSTLSR